MPKTSNGQHLYITGMRNLQELVHESESEDEETVVRQTRSKTSFGDIMAQAKTCRDVVTEDRKRRKTAEEKKSEGSDARANTSRSQLQASMSGAMGLSRAQKAPRENDQYHPEDPLLERHPFAVKNTNHLQSKRDQYSSVPLCKHLELFLDWNMDDPDNRKGSWILNIEKYEDPSPWAEHRHCAGVDVTKMADALAMRIIKKFTRLDNERVSRDFDRGISCRRPPAKQRLTRELCNMYSQIHRGKESKLVDEKEALRESLNAAERRKELAGEALLRAQKSRQTSGAAKPVNNDVSEGRDKSSSASVSGSSPSIKKRKTPKQIAEEKVARNRKRKGLSEIARIPAEPVDRFKSTTVDERDARLAGVAQQVRPERATETKKSPSVTKPSSKSKKSAVAIDPDEDVETISRRRVTKKTTLPPAPIFSDSENEHSEEELVTKRNATTKSQSQHMSKPERALLKGIAKAEQEERERYAQDGPEPLPTSEEKEAAFRAEIEAIGLAQLAAQKRKLSETEDDIPSHVLPSSRLIKKAKKNSVTKEVV
ncbi:uncharacterized protein J4E84_005696 [Alternaria hordeiaustralica]|uniref:uncharacterized protein n=1 Tax=Alternaria hordeiaustralica TaxID=1187925 RepID=UPI0020C5380C|nr:uncharacterized protein J4E84_005696 [Alternaria hordeiaustralica]KAI4686417.1 hypothetical protein J4E84_005696 [Alternaria hordeiaustralica]